MSRSFTKLFSSITESTVWCEPAATRIAWITMLAMADRHGRVWASVPGLANRARITIEETETALERFLAPDPYSRTPDHEGRRIEVIDGGWRLLNYEKYRALRDEDERRVYQRAWDREHRSGRVRNPTNPTDSDRDEPGVYEFGNANETVVYIGSSNEVRRRLKEHLDESTSTCIKRNTAKYRIEYTNNYKKREQELYDEFVRTNGRAPQCNDVRPAGA